jgi:hypothetical protein
VDINDFPSSEQSVFRTLAERLGIDVVYVNEPNLDLATTLLMPTTRTGLKEPTIAVNIAKANEDTEFYGMGSYIVDAVRNLSPEIIGGVFRRYEQYNQKQNYARTQALIEGKEIEGDIIELDEYESAFIRKLDRRITQNSNVFPNLNRDMSFLQALSEVVSEELLAVQEGITERADSPLTVNEIVEEFFSEISARAAGSEKAAAAQVVDVRGYSASEIISRMFEEGKPKKIADYKKEISRTNDIRKGIVEAAKKLESSPNSATNPNFNYDIKLSRTAGNYNLDTVSELGDEKSIAAMEYFAKIYSDEALEKIKAKGGHPSLLGDTVRPFNDEVIRDDQLLKREVIKVSNWEGVFGGSGFIDTYNYGLDTLLAGQHAGFSEDNKHNRHFMHSLIADRLVFNVGGFDRTFNRLFEGNINDFLEGKIGLELSDTGKTYLENLDIDLNEDVNQSMLYAIKSALYRPVILKDIIEKAVNDYVANKEEIPFSLLAGIKRLAGNDIKDDFDMMRRRLKTTINDTGSGLRDLSLSYTRGVLNISYKYVYENWDNDLEEVPTTFSVDPKFFTRRRFNEPVTEYNNLVSSEMYGSFMSRMKNEHLVKHDETNFYRSNSRGSTHERVVDFIGMRGKLATAYGIFTEGEMSKYVDRQIFDGEETRLKDSSLMRMSPMSTWNLVQLSKGVDIMDKINTTDGDLSTVYTDLLNHFKENVNKRAKAGSKYNTVYDVFDEAKKNSTFKASMRRALMDLSRRKNFTVKSDTAPEGLKQLDMYVSAGNGSVSFGVEKWGTINSFYGNYVNVPSVWGYGRQVSKEVNSFLEEIAKEIPIADNFHFMAVSSSFIDDFNPIEIDKNIDRAKATISNLESQVSSIANAINAVLSEGSVETETIKRLKRDIKYQEDLIDVLESRKKFSYSEGEMKVQSNFLRQSLYNAWATKAFGGALHLKSRAIQLFQDTDGEYYAVSNNSQDRKAFPNLFMHPKKARDIFQRGERGANRQFQIVLESLKNDGNAPSPLNEANMEAILKYFGIPYKLPTDGSDASAELILRLKNGFSEISYTEDAERIKISDIIKTISNESGVFDFVSNPVKPSELQAYMEGATDGSDVVDALENLRDEEKAIIEGYTKKRPFSLDNIKGRIFNRYQGLRDAINSGLSAYTRSLLTKRTGYAMYADKMFRDYDEKIFKGLSIGQEVLLDDIIHLRRVIQIDTNFDERREGIERQISHMKAQLEATNDKKLKKHIKKELKILDTKLADAKRPLHPTPSSFKGKVINKEEAIKGLAAYEARMTPKEFADLSKRADAYFDAHRDMLAYARDIGLINEETYDRFSSDDYSPRIFLEKMFGDSPDHTFRGTKLDDNYIKAIRSGSDLAMFTDARQLLSLSLRAIRTKDIQNQLTKSMHNDAKKKNYAGVDFMKPLNTKTSKGKTTVEAADKGFVNAFYKVDGELEGFQIKADLYPQLTGNVKNYIEIPSAARKVFRTVLGVPILKALATGVNTAFAVTAAMRFVPEAVLGRGVYDKYRFLPLMAGAATIDILSATKDAIFNKALVEEYLSAGGETIWMSSYGRPESAIKRKNKSLLAAATNKIAKSGFDKISWAANKSELAARLALYKRAKENLSEQYAGKLNEEQIRSLAVEEAIMLADFATSGTLSKDIDMVSPYFNPAVQGFRGAVSYIKSNPKMAAGKLGQFFASSFALQLVAMLSMDDDEWDRISDYQKQMYLHIPLGRNDEGDMRTLKLPRAHNFIPVSSLATIMAQHARDIIRGKEVKADKDSKDYRSFDDGKYLIESIMRGMPVPSAAPLINAYMVVNHNIDMWRGENVNYESDNVRDYVKGLYDKNVRDFYKYIALKSYDVGIGDVSPRTMQTAVEKFITNDRNFLVDQAYRIADALAIHGGKLDKLMDKHGVNYESIDKEKSKIINSLFGVKGRIYTIPKTKFKDGQKVKDVALEKNTKMFKMKKNIRESAIEYSKKEGTLSNVPKSVLDEINSMTDNPFERKALVSWWKYYYRGKLVPEGIANIMFSESSVEKLAKIEELVGDVSQLDQQDYIDLMTNLATAGMRKDQELNKLINEKRKKQK